MRFIPALIAVLIVLSGAIALVPLGASAAVGTDSITTNNVYGNAQANFTVDGALFFSVYVNTSAATPISIDLINTTSGSAITSTSVTTSTSGVYQSWIVSNFNFFDLTGYAPGSYELQLSIAGSPVANASFAISYPVYTAKIHTTLSSYVKYNSYYLVGDFIYVKVTAVDQFGNPMSGNTTAGLYEMLYGGRANTTQYRQLAAHLAPDDFGIATVAFYSGTLGYQVSGYNLTALFGGYPAGSSARDPAIGHSVYYLISPTLQISPYRPNHIYGQGTNLTFQGYFSPYSAPVNVSIVSYRNGATIFTGANLPVHGGYWNYSYLVPYSVPDGYYYLNISEASNNYSIYTTYLQFEALVVSAYANVNHYVPGEPATVFYTVTNTSNNAPASSVNVTYTMNYTTSGGQQSVTGIVSGGVLNTVIPSASSIPSTVIITLYAVDSYGHNASQIVYLSVDPLIGTLSTSQASYYQSEPVIVQVDAMAGQSIFSSSPVANALVNVNVSVGGSIVLAYSGSSLLTDTQGIASYAFMLGANATLGTYTVDAKISAYGWSNTTITSFSVVRQSVEYSLQIVPGQSSYVGGQEFSATWSLVKNGTIVTPAFASYAASIGNMVIAAGTNSNGLISFQVPIGTSGDIYLQVTASDSNGDAASASAYVPVARAILVLNPSAMTYSPSSVITFSYSIFGSGFSSPVYFYTISDANGNIVASESTLATSFQFSVPKYPTSSYTVELTAMNKSSGGVITSSVTVYEISGLQLSFTLSQSSFISNSYSPGQKVTIYYRIIAMGGSSLSSAYDLDVYIYGFQTSYRQYTVSASSGSVSYTLPSGLSQGNYLIEVQAFSATGPGSTQPVLQNLQISQSQPFWNYNVIGGISIGTAILGIVALVALAFSFAAYSGKRRRTVGGGQQRSQGPKAERAPEEHDQEQEGGGEGPQS